MWVRLKGDDSGTPHQRPPPLLKEGGTPTEVQTRIIISQYIQGKDLRVFGRGISLCGTGQLDVFADLRDQRALEVGHLRSNVDLQICHDESPVRTQLRLTRQRVLRHTTKVRQAVGHLHIANVQLTRGEYAVTAVCR